MKPATTMVRRGWRRCGGDDQRTGARCEMVFTSTSWPLTRSAYGYAEGTGRSPGEPMNGRAASASFFHYHYCDHAGSQDSALEASLTAAEDPPDSHTLTRSGQAGRPADRSTERRQAAWGVGVESTHLSPCPLVLEALPGASTSARRRSSSNSPVSPCTRASCLRGQLHAWPLACWTVLYWECILEGRTHRRTRSRRGLVTTIRNDNCSWELYTLGVDSWTGSSDGEHGCIALSSILGGFRSDTRRRRKYRT